MVARNAILQSSFARWSFASAVAAGLALAATPTRAQCIGNCGADGADGVVTLSPTGHSSYQYISTSGGSAGAGEIPGVGGTNGSELASAVFNATAKESLQFYFNYITSDGAGFSDYAWAELETSTGAHVAWLFTARTEPTGNTSPGAGLPADDSTLVPPTSAIIPGGPVWSKLGGSSGQCFDAGCGYTGWIQSTYGISTAGSYKVVFGVTNWTDTEYDSGLAFDGLEAGGIPIPTGCGGAPGINIKASAGQPCYASGPYVSTNVIAGQATGAGSVLTNVTAAGAQNPVSFSTSAANTPAVQADAGGSVILAAPPSSTSATVTTTGGNSIGLYATGSGSTINAQNVDVATHGINASGVQADNGGVVTLNGGSVKTSGNGAVGLAANPGGSISATGVTVTTSGGYDPNSGSYADGLSAWQGGKITFTGGSVIGTGSATGAVDSNGAGSSVTLDGTMVSTTGAGSQGLVVLGSGATLTATNVTVTTTGATDPVSGFQATGVVNAGYGSLSGGGTVLLTNTSVATSGSHAVGVATADGGATTISGGTVMTSGANALGLRASGGGSSITTTNGASIATTGAQSAAVQADTGASVALNGGTVTASGAGSEGLFAMNAGSTIAAMNVAVTTSGGYNPMTGNGGATVLSYDGGGISVSGGSITNAAAYTSGAVVAQGSGSTVSLSGGTAILTTGAGVGGLVTLGAGASLMADNVSVTTRGGVDPNTGVAAIGAYNGYNSSYPGLTAGGAMSLTNSTIATTGSGASGVVTNSGGVTSIAGGSVATAGQDAHALVATGAGSQVNLSGSNSFATQGAGAIGLYAALGAVVTADASSITTVTTAGGVSPSTGLGAHGVNADGAGSQIRLGAATITTSGAGAFGLYASDAAASGSAGSIAASGLLSLTTTNAAATAVGLQGNGAAIVATGGGTITAAGRAIAFLDGSNQTATFDNFTINAKAGDLVFADPSVATVNFSNTVADAGSGNLLNATQGSAVTFNAAGSSLTGAIVTDPTSTSNVNLANGSTWNMAASSNVSNLAVTRSTVVFAPPSAGGGFKTLTVGNYVGSGATMVMNAALGGSNSAADQLVVNGGAATGSTLLAVKNIGGAGGQTSGSGIPLVVAKNGGTIAPDAFALADSPVIGGFRYTLDETNGDWFLVSTPTTTQAQMQSSVTSVAKAQQAQAVTGRVLGSLLIGATQQISCSSCGSGFASIGSLAFGMQGRWTLSPQLTLIGGASYNQWTAQGISVYSAPTVAGSLIYDMSNLGSSRPFFQVGGGLTPYESVHTARSYPNGAQWAVGNSIAVDRSLSLFARAGWLARLTPSDEAAAYVDIGRSWMQTGGYTEQTTAQNPYPASAGPGLQTLNIARLGGQYTHLFFGTVEANVGGAVAYGFGAGAGTFVNVYEFGPIAPGAVPNSTWFEYGGRLGYRVNRNLVVDAFVLGTAGGDVGNTIHGGVGLRLAF